jgi:hypothetical protein
LQIGDEANGRKIHQLYNKAMFQGHRIKLNPSKADYLERLEYERAAAATDDAAALEKRRATAAAMALESKGPPTTIFRLRPKPGAEVRRRLRKVLLSQIYWLVEPCSLRIPLVWLAASHGRSTEV